MTKYVAPIYELGAFHCPFCGAFSKHSWSEVHLLSVYDEPEPYAGWTMAVCNHCEKPTLWYGKAMVYPLSAGPPAHQDMPEKVSVVFEEARAIAGKSPKGAAALLRLCVQLLCKEIGESGKDINNDIGSLVRKGLPTEVQQAFDILRVIGNNAVHPGQIDLGDKPETATSLFDLVNFVVDRMISQPKNIQELFETLPESSKGAIAKRDGKPF